MMARFFFGTLIVLWPLFGFGPVPLPFLVLGAVLAYDGVSSRLWTWTLLLAATEVIYSVNLGVYSLAFALTAMLMAVAGHWLNLRPLSRENGWAPSLLAKAVMTAFAAACFMSALSVAVGVYVYGNGNLATRLALEFANGRWLALWLLVTVLAVFGLRHSDEPFRKKITFGV